MKDLSFRQIEAAVRKNPVMPDIEDKRDYHFEDFIAGDIEIPAKFSLRDKQTSVKSQGSRGTCTAFAGAGVAEYFNVLEHGEKDLDLSEEMLFKLTKDVDVADYNYTGYGAHIRSVAKALKAHGACLEKTLPYKPKESEDSWKRVIITAFMFKEAEMYKMENYLSVRRNVSDIQRAIITSQGPVIGAFKLMSSYRKAKTNKGIVPTPAQGEEVIGGHAMFIIGWKTINGELYFELKNSWGDTWGDKGYLWWPAQTMHLISSLWSFVDLITNPNVLQDKVLEENRKKVSDYALEAWDKATKKGLITAGTLPQVTMSKQDFFVFLVRLGLL